METDTYKLEDLGFLGRGKSRHRPRNDSSLFGGKYPFIQTGEVKAAEFYLNSFEETYNEKGLEQSKLWDPGTLLITIAANIAETAILDIKACFPDSIIGFVPDKDKADVRYIKYYIDTIKLRMQNISKGTTQDNLSLEKLRSIDFEIPSVENQERIASILTAFDKLIENNAQRIDILEEMARLVYHEWFVHYRYPGHESDKLVDSGTDLGEVPEGWSINKTGDKFTCVLGGTPSRKNDNYWTNGTVSWINSGAINNLRIIEPSELITEVALKKSAAKLMPARTTLIAITGATLGQVSINEIATSANQSVVGVFDKERSYNEWLYFTFKNRIDELIAQASGGAQQHINKGIVEDFHLIIPPEPLIIKYKQEISPLFDLIRSLLFKNKTLKQTRDLLLPKLISGKVEV